MTYRRVSVVAALLLVVALLAGGAYALSRPEQPDQIRASLALADVLGGNASGYARALAPRPFVFPADHGPHPDYRSEWWYWTGNLETAAGRHFGFQLTFFRSALSPAAATRESSWGTNQVYMAHFALTDVAGKRFQAFERFARGAAGLAGAQAAPFHVWLEDWSATGQGSDLLPLTLHAAQGDVAIDLKLAGGKPVVLQGDRGLSRKGPEPGDASYYYSLTRLPTSGTVHLGAEEFAVTGLSWLDREWSTSALAPEQAGWDWFSLQLADGREVMYYQLRRRDDGRDPFSAGTLVAADGTARALGPDDVQVEVLDRWQSPRDGTSYPARWRLHLPSGGLDLEVTPYLPDQELNLSVRYWEGAVRLAGTSDGEPLAGSGYVELTGYGDAARR